MKKKKFISKCTAIIVMAAIAFLTVLVAMPAKNVNAEGVTLAGGVSTEELAAYWKLNETSGNKAIDLSGHGRHLNLLEGSQVNWKENGPTDSTRSFKFDGNSAFLMFANGSFNETETGGNYWIQTNYHADGKTQRVEDDQSLTISFFVQIDDITYDNTKPDVNGFNLLFGNEGLAVGVAGSLEGAILNAEHFKSTGNLDVGQYDPEYNDNWLFGGIKGAGGIMGGTDQVVAPQNVNNKFEGKWTMLTYVVDDSFERDTSDFMLYVNGVQVKKTSLALTVGLVKSLGNELNAFCIGGWKGESGSSPGAKRGFSGSMSEFMIFTRPLAASEVSTLYNGYIGQPGGGDEEPDPIVVTLNKSIVSSLKVGETVQLTATVTGGADDDVKTVNWTTSDVSKATVDATGKVTAKATGAVTITATSKADNTKSAACAINIVEQEGGGGCGSTIAGSFSGGIVLTLILLPAVVFLVHRRKISD